MALCSPERVDGLGCVEGVCESVLDGVIRHPLEVVEPGFLLSDLTGGSVTVVKKVRAQDVGHLVRLMRRGKNGEAVLLKGVFSAGQEPLEVANSVMAVLVIEMESWVVEALTAMVEEVFTEVPFEFFPMCKGARELAIDQEDGKKAAKSLRHHVLDSVCEALDPFVVGLREATGDTRITKSRVDKKGPSRR